MMLALCFLLISLPAVVAAQNASRVDGASSNFFFGHPHEFEFVNWHDSINVGGPYEETFYPKSYSDDEGAKFQSADFLQGLREIQDAIEQAETDGKRLRAYGSKWSLSDVAYTSEYLLQTWGLNYVKVGIDNPNYVTDDYQDKKDNLVFVQAGVMIQHLHEALFEKKLALSTTGAADGQRIAGAISTGTHGAANQFGSMQEFVRAIHIVVPGGHYLLQRASDRAVTADYAEYLDGAIMMDDDDLFNAALVSFGSFGVIHGYVIEAEPLYKLKVQSKQMSYREVKDVLLSMDVAKLGFEGVDELPFHFEVTLNPYKRNSRRKGAFVRVIQKIPYDDDELSRVADGIFRENPEGDDIFDATGAYFTRRRWAIGKIPRRFLYRIGVSVPLVSFFDTRRNDIKIRHPFELFTSPNSATPRTRSPVPGTGMELGVPQEKIVDTIELVMDIMHDDPTATPVAVRFVKPSNATLAFTKFGDYTATLETPGPYAKYAFRETRRVQQKIYDALEERRDEIPHAYHWGQAIPVNSYWVRNSFREKLDEWKAQREVLLDKAGREMFASDLIVALGLHDEDEV